MNGMRNGIGIFKAVGGSVKLKAAWKDDKIFGKAITENTNIFTAIFQLDYESSSGKFSYYLPISFAKLFGTAKLLGS